MNYCILEDYYQFLIKSHVYWVKINSYIRMPIFVSRLIYMHHIFLFHYVSKIIAID